MKPYVIVRCSSIFVVARAALGLLLILIQDSLVKLFERGHLFLVDQVELGDKEEEVTVVGVQMG